MFVFVVFSKDTFKTEGTKTFIILIYRIRAILSAHLVLYIVRLCVKEFILLNKINKSGLKNYDVLTLLSQEGISI